MQLCSMQRLILTVCCIATIVGSPFVNASPIGWDFAVALKSKILFLDNKWNIILSAAHEYDQLSGLAFDEAEEVIYFNDHVHETGSIFSLRREARAALPIVEQAVQRTGNDSVAGLAYDPLNRNLFWVDTHHNKIFFGSVDTLSNEAPKVLLDLSSEESWPTSVAIDICRRQLYWTNYKVSNSTVERMALDGTNRQTIISEGVDEPRGIVVDQFTDRIFWVDKRGIFFTVESSKLDGSDHQTVIKDKFQEPIQLAVTDDTIYWTDKANKAVWSYPIPSFTNTSTNSTQNFTETPAQPEPKKVATLTENVYSIVARNGFYQRLQKDEHCGHIVRKIKQRLQSMDNLGVSTLSPVEKRVSELENEHCLNGATFRSKGNFCICPVGFKGARCEISECHNYCVHGTCKISERGFPKCYCQTNFYGERCGYDKCSGYCLNGGQCSVNQESGEVSCKCSENFTGSRCEQNTTESCAIYCQQLKQQPDTIIPVGCQEICVELSNNNNTSIATFNVAKSMSCTSSWPGYMIPVLVGGVICCLALVAVIVHGLRLIYKPKRPHIKKTFVIRKQPRHNSSSDTPLTNRPLGTEQCEITIENCCNMNICETPCFDPKLVEQTFSARDNKRAQRVKEDKKILIHNMADDMLS